MTDLECSLKEWLQHSQKQHCELCKTPFRFTKLYDPQMPSRLPAGELFRNAARDVHAAFILACRWTLASWVWLVWLPYCTRHIWRACMILGDNAVSVIPPSNRTSLLAHSAKIAADIIRVGISNETEVVGSNNVTIADLNDRFVPFNIDRLTRYPILNRLITDVLEGQIITSTIIAVFVVAFLIREWIVVNNAELLAEAGQDGQLIEVEVQFDEAGNLIPPQLPPNAQNVQVVIEAVPQPPPVPPAIQAIGELFIERGQRAARESVPSPLLNPSFRGNSSIFQHSPELDCDPENPFDTAMNSQMTDEVRNLASSWRPATPSRSAEMMTSAEMRAVQREAALEAATRRMQGGVPGSPLRNRVGPVDQTAESIERAFTSAQVPTSAPRTRFRAARARSAERRAWELDDRFNNPYPDSPMPQPRRDLADPSDLALERGRSPTPVDNPAQGMLRREVEIAASSQLQHPAQRRAETPEATLASYSQAEFARRVNDYWAANTLVQRQARIIDNFEWCASLLREYVNGVEAHPPVDDPEVQEIIRRLEVFARLAARTDVVETYDFRKCAEKYRLVPIAPAPGAMPVQPEQAARAIGIHIEQNVAAAAANEEPLREDEIEGLLDLIGVHGSVVALFQNTMLVVVLVLSFVMSCVQLPYLLGSLSLAIVREPLKNFVYKPAAFVELFGRECLKTTEMLLQPLVKHSRAIYWLRVGVIRMFESDMAARASASAYALRHSVVSQAKDRLAAVTSAALSGNEEALQILLTKIQNAVPERVLAVAAGYVTASLIGALYLQTHHSLMPHGSLGRQIDMALRAGLRQAGYVIKFVVVLDIELLIFPCYCGLLLDGVLLPLFDATLAERVQFSVKYPFTSFYLHWLLGTIYMFSFALFVGMCRRVLRPGLLFFIRDPNDPAFNPIKDILERPMLNQMRKILVSVLIYGALLLFGFGSVVWAIKNVFNILPLQLTTPTSGTSIVAGGFDAILLQVAFPVAIRVVNVTETFRDLWKAWFTMAAAALRLSSFVMGERRADEESSSVFATAIGLAKVAHEQDGGFRRVPQSDNVPMRDNRHQQMVFEVDQDNNPIIPIEDDSTRDDPNYTLVYVPPFFKTRLALFMLSIWFFAVVLTLSTTVIPLLLGRQLYKTLMPERVVLDTMAYNLGALSLFSIAMATKAVGKVSTVLHGLATPMHVAPTAEGTAQPAHVPNVDVEGLLSNVGASLKFVAKWAYIFLVAVILVPLLVGLCTEVYVIMPLTTWIERDSQPTFHFLNDWVQGLVAIKTLTQYGWLAQDTWLGQSLNGVLRNDRRQGWRDPDIRLATTRLFVPSVLISGSALLMPLAAAYAAERSFYRGNMSPDVHNAIYRLCYPACLLSVSMVLLFTGLRTLLGRWSQKIRDELYLKGNMLHNYGEEQAAAAPAIGHHTETAGIEQQHTAYQAYTGDDEDRDEAIVQQQLQDDYYARAWRPEQEANPFAP